LHDRHSYAAESEAAMGFPESAARRDSEGQAKLETAPLGPIDPLKTPHPGA
jgi:hypothetical protein